MYLTHLSKLLLLIIDIINLAENESKEKAAGVFPAACHLEQSNRTVRQQACRLILLRFAG